MEIIDVLTPRINECPSFVVNVSFNSVNLTAFPGGSRYEAGGGVNIFQRGDNFMLLSVGYFIPEGFALASYPGAGMTEFSAPIIFCAAEGVGGGAPIAFEEIGNGGLLRLPMPNYEMSVGPFVEIENVIADNWFFRGLFPYTAGVDIPQVSMINAPAALDGETVHVVPFVKVLHNLPMTV
ncbi:MAG: hypothetical protein PHS93_08480 [Candidatus Omnitrophica bacterium]|nr:hypothetical protein [Candidatus Neomarinimicrobiota bacterium]MDD5353179.1 hypothetical protein [Candidatus Omnitrophota bacterium]